METLVEIAKRLKIQPKHNMTQSDYLSAAKKIGQELCGIKTGLPADRSSEQRRYECPENLSHGIYMVRAFRNRGWTEQQQKKVRNILQHTGAGVFAHAHRLGTEMSETTYIHHTSEKFSPPIERFTLDIDIMSRHFGDMIPKLDAFIAKHSAAFKVGNAWCANRTDTMEVYMPCHITPKIARELYQVVKPCLSEKYHDCLNGVELYDGSRVIKGMKIGPEPSALQIPERQKMEAVYYSLYQDFQDRPLSAFLTKQLKELYKNSSLGGLCGALQVADLMYFLSGKEGKSPFRLKDCYNQDYKPHLVLPAMDQERQSSIKKSLWSRFMRDVKRPASVKVSFDWKDSRLWSDVKKESLDKKGIHFGHRLNVSDVPAAERAEIKKQLDNMGIKYIERRATTYGPHIQPGDETIQVVDGKSVEKLRDFVFMWARHNASRPIYMTKEAYKALHDSQELLRIKASGR